MCFEENNTHRLAACVLLVGSTSQPAALPQSHWMPPLGSLKNILKKKKSSDDDQMLPAMDALTIGAESGSLVHFNEAQAKAPVMKTSLGRKAKVQSGSTPNSASSQLTPEQQDEAALLSILESLLLRSAGGRAAPLPVVAHSERIPSSARAVSLPFLRAMRLFLERHGGADRSVAEVCSEGDASICALTASTGLSLAESVAMASARDEVAAARRHVGEASGYFSYSWTGATLGELLEAIDETVDSLQEVDGVERRVWIDLFSASQNLLAGAYQGPKVAAAAEREWLHARRQESSQVFEQALASANEFYFCASPLVGRWEAPRHAFIDGRNPSCDDGHFLVGLGGPSGLGGSGTQDGGRFPRRFDPMPQWHRHGPMATTRAWCLCELVAAQDSASGARRALWASPTARSLAADGGLLLSGLHVVLTEADRCDFGRLLWEDFGAVAGSIGAVDARDAQLAQPHDSEHLAARVRALTAEGTLVAGLEEVTARVVPVLQAWLMQQARAHLAQFPPETAASSLLLEDVARMLQAQGRLEEATSLVAEALQLKRARLGDSHPLTLSSTGLMGRLMYAAGNLGVARELCEETVTQNRALLGDAHPDTLGSISNLATLMQVQGELSLARPLVEELLASRRTALGEEHPDTLAAVGLLSSLEAAEGERLQRRERRVARRRAPDEGPPPDAAGCRLVQSSPLTPTADEQGAWAAPLAPPEIARPPSTSSGSPSAAGSPVPGGDSPGVHSSSELGQKLSRARAARREARRGLSSGSTSAVPGSGTKPTLTSDGFVMSPSKMPPWV